MGRLQTWPQVPQFWTSVWRFAHRVPQLSGVVPAQLLPHWKRPLMFAQSAVVPEQLTVHDPQVSGRVRLASHPSLGVALQSPNPALHEATAQVPASHLAWALGRLQTCPQVPQFWTSVCRFAHRVPQLSGVAPEQLLPH